MKANAKSRARSLMTVGIVLGTITAAAVVPRAARRRRKKRGRPKRGIGLSQIDPVANAPEAAMPVDATPSPDGSQIYFIAFSSRKDADGFKMERVPAIYKVAATGGAPAKLFEGDPLQSPFGITISDDGQTLFIADSSADGNAESDRSDGRVFSMSANGGAPTAMAGTEGITPAASKRSATRSTSPVARTACRASSRPAPWAARSR